MSASQTRHFRAEKFDFWSFFHVPDGWRRCLSCHPRVILL